MILLENINHDELKKYLKQFYNHALDNLKIDKAPTLVLINDKNNADWIFGKTGYYNPDEHKIGLYVADRHAKDILRSFAHELIHHEQNLTGLSKNLDLSKTASDPAYASHDDGLREMERDAFERGNMLFRDWCDQQKLKGRKNMSETKQLEELILKRVTQRLIAESKMPMKTDKKDVDGDGNKNEKVPAFLDKGDVKKSKKDGKVPPQLQKFVNKKKKGKEAKKPVKEGGAGFGEGPEGKEDLNESIQHPYPELFKKRERLNEDRFQKHEELIYQELLKRAIK